MKTKRFLLEAAILIALALIFSGCGDDGGGTDSESPSLLGGEIDEKAVEGEPDGDLLKSSLEEASSSSATPALAQCGEHDPRAQFCFNGMAVDKCAGNPQEYDPALYECRAGKRGVYLKEDVVDYLGGIYEAVLIGEQTWLARNLNYDGACFEEDKISCETDGNKYGRKYVWNAAVCPEGWHVPLWTEWFDLAAYAGGRYNAGAKLMVEGGWTKIDGTPVIGTNDYGFSALPYSTGSKVTNAWWSSYDIVDPLSGKPKAWYFKINGQYNNGDVEIAYGDISSKYSVRCIKNSLKNIYGGIEPSSSSSSSSFVSGTGCGEYDANTQFCYNGKVGNKCGANPQSAYDPDVYECKPKVNPNGIFLKTPAAHEDGTAYEAVLIGTQVWLASNVGGRMDWAAAMGLDESYNSKIYGTVSYYCYNLATCYESATPQKGICPEGFHIPSGAEWIKLKGFVGSAGKLKGGGWSRGVSTNDYGFSALPVAGDNWNNTRAEFWTSSEVDWHETNPPLGPRQGSYFQIDDAMTYYHENPKGALHTVRCVMD